MDRRATTWWRALSLSAVLVLSSSAPVWAQSATDSDGDGIPDGDAPRWWSISATLATRIGQGTFADPANDLDISDEVGEGDNAFDRVTNSYRLDPALLLGGGKYNITLDILWTHNLVAGGGLGTNEPNQFRFQDMTLSAQYAGHRIASTGTILIPSLALGIPTSLVSQTATTVIDTSITGVIVQPIVGRLTLIYAAVGGKTFHRFKSPTVENTEVGISNALFRDNGPENLGDGLIALGGVNTEFYLFNVFGVNIPIGPVLMRVRYSLRDFWTYDTDNDDGLRNQNADPGRGHAQIIGTSVSLTYPVFPWLAATGGISTSMPPRTDDQRSLRFPFWNFNGAAANFSTINFSLTGFY